MGGLLVAMILQLGAGSAATAAGAGPYRVQAKSVYLAGAAKAEVYLPGASASEAYLPGAEKTQVE